MAVFVREDIPFLPVQLNSPLQAVAVKVFLDRWYTLCSLYLPLGDRVHAVDFVNLASFVEDEGLEVLNSGDITYFHSPTGTFTAIDLSLCSCCLYLNFNWSVLPDLYGSDHFPILSESVASVPQSRPPR